MAMSPDKKRPRLISELNSNKRRSETGNSSKKRAKTESSTQDVQSQRRRNFIRACEKVSYNAYQNYRERLQLLYLPACMNSSCVHQDYKEGLNVKQVSPHVEEMFKIEVKSNMWCEALEVCRLCINPTQYLSANILKDIVEIMMNAHEDETAEYSVSNIICQCQQILALNFSTHPPCLMKNIRKCYNTFLTSPMELKDTFTNRTEFECEKGIVKYSMNRLEYEISIDSKDEALVNKNENIPEEMKQSVKGLHWQKEKMEIFELLHRSERIERLMAVLNSIIELLQFDLAIWHSRYTNNLGCHIMRSHKPIMAYVLWSNNVLYTGAVNNNCRQILRLFTHFVHLRYPEDHIRTIQLWLNAMIQTFYICENNSNNDYPNTGKYCMAFANEFYKIISDMPHESKIVILDKIKPTFMQHLIGIIHLKNILSTDEDNVITIFINVLKRATWTKFPTSSNANLPKKPLSIKNIKPNKFLKFLSFKCKELSLEDINQNRYPKYMRIENETDIDQSHLMTSIYITFQAFLDAYSVQDIQETLDMLNRQLDEMECMDSIETSYSVTEHFIKKYRGIYQLLRELVLILNKMRDENQLPQVLRIFENISLLGL